MDVESHGLLSTAGQGAVGLLAQSVGGGGGSGGFSLAGSGAGTGAGTFSMGGAGDAGGYGHEVGVVSHSDIYTLGTEAHALFAQSVGGGGGSGGFSLAGVGAGTGAGSLSLGGSAGGGGYSQRVDVESHGFLATAGDEAIGLFAQSVGGGGGSGGFSIAGALGGTGGGAVSLGGSGGDGGDSGQVWVNSSSDIHTLGLESHGLFAQSVGGGGGKGGFSIATAFAGTGAGSLSLGGSGGGGGTAERVDVTSSGLVLTEGEGAVGLYAQSVGGGGGSGGFSVAGTAAKSAGGSLSLGGSGGDGGDGGAVSVVNTGNVRTAGEDAGGIIAQSIGGGGGNGGFALSGSFGGKEAKSIAVTVGGSGGSGGDGSTVRVDSGGEIHTAGQDAHGLFAQSVGGGGGSGGSAVSVGFGVTGEQGWNVNASVAVGGSGGDGGIGGDVFVGSAGQPVDGLITTRGDDAHGIYAQSIGGGGGTGGSSTAINIDVDRPKPGEDGNGDGEEQPEGNSLNVSLSVGGSGGDGNTAGNVVIDNAADLGTFGAQSHGIFAQSVGGGGGGGGRAAALSLSTGDLMPWADMQGDNWGLDVAVGGSGGGGNDAGSVTLTNRGTIYTEGALSRGIFAQSIGGGGGSGAQGVLGTGINWVDDALEALSPIQTAFAIKGIIENPTALLPKSGSLTVGGGDGVSGDADAVFIDNLGDITTRGLSSHAIYAQSVGGGGGEAQLYARARGEEDENGAAEEAWVGIGVIGDLLLGGADGAAGDGGRVDVLHSGNIYTAGQAASGIYAQSVGGGGGQAGSVEGGLADPLQIGLGFEYQREGGGDGAGGFVNVESSGAIVTSGEASVGIFAQSVGGGGGVIGNVGGVAFAGSVGGSGAGGEVSVSHAGDIVTSGDAAHGIFAQSAGGSVETGAAAGQVTVTVDGRIQASGADASGILAQSVGGGAGAEGNHGNVSVRVEAGGSVLGGSGNGAGVRVLDGIDNAIANYGTVGALSDLAVIAGAGNEALDNHGALYGAVDLGAGSNSLVNHTGGVLHTGAGIELGAGNTLTNAGRLSPGGDGVVASTAIGGNLLQTGAGALSIDLDTRNMTADYLGVSGDAGLDGLLGVRMLDIGYVMPGSHSLVLLTAGGGLVDQGLALQTAASAVVSYELEFDADEGLVLHYLVDFSAPEGLSENQGALGDYVNRLQAAGGSASFAPLAAQLFTLPDGEAVGEFYERLSPAPHFGPGNATLAANQQFADGLLSCRQHGGLYRFSGETDCSWLRLAGRRLTQDRVGDVPGFEEDVINVAGGAQEEVSENLFVGAALSYETGRLKSDGLARTDLDRFQGGLMAKQLAGNWLGAAGLTVGFGQYDAERFVEQPDPGVVATSRQDMRFVALRSRLAYTVERDAWYFKPMLDANVTWADFHGFRERGAGGANLVVASRSETYTSVNPAVELGVEVQADEAGFTRLYGRLGAIHYLSGTPEITATLEGAPAGVAPFRTTGELDETYLDVALGVDLVRGRDFGLKFEYAGQLSGDTEQHGVQLKFARRF
ncbi:autotransporter outer membrane beta-barrel domain-containing protein [Thioalkalivibrio sp. XN8]|uniref:autotransporter outer membrane beta-barrel domain-containing protein n=1 Tax=Thioalkalivibrio sp. XN8 TaxID=2712863 RepID=UPI0019808E1D|nr:autotransporter outer membrane beta-barrel domain-containing protein [Thioalkalivibrio sp. XN8]